MKKRIASGVRQSTSNEKATVEAIFDVDGYRMYRFQDSVGVGVDVPAIWLRSCAGRNVYFVLPARGERLAHLETTWTDLESCGKNCWREVPYRVVTEPGR